MLFLKNRKLLAFLFLVLLTSCSSNESNNKSNKGYAPKDIRGYIFSTTSEKINKDDKDFENSMAYYYFYEDDTYDLILKGKNHMKGSFSYKKVAPNVGEAILTYIYKNQEKSYTMKLIFDSPSSGEWKNSYELNLESDETGRFTMKKS